MNGIEIEEGFSSFELLSLISVKESKRVSREGFENADQEAVEEVGKRARMGEEKVTFLRAGGWVG